MAEKFWVQGTGDLSDNTNHWSDSSGGAPNAVLPGNGDNINFDEHSNEPGDTDYTVTVDAAERVAGATFTNPPSGNPTLTMDANLFMRGDVALCSGMTIDGNSQFVLEPAAGQTLTMNGCEPSAIFNVANAGGTITLQDTFTSTSQFVLSSGTLDTNGQTVTCTVFASNNANVRVLTLGASVINCESVDMSTTTNLTFNANTSVINTTGNFLIGYTAGGGKTFATVNFNGNLIWAGDSTFGTVGSDTTAKTITVEAGSTQTITTWGINGSEAANITLVSFTPDTSYEIAVGAGTVDMSFCDVTDCEATGGAKFLGGENGGGNTGFYRFKSDARQFNMF